MALIAMCTWDTKINQRSDCTKQTLQSLAKTVDFTKHRMIMVDNNSCNETQELYEEAKDWLPFELIKNKENVGTALAINRAWYKRKPGEHALKMDSDIIVEEAGWLDKLEECIEADEKIGICGLKRKDLLECPDSPSPWFKSTLKMLPRQHGDKWLIVEQVLHVIGSCQLYNSKLLDICGYMVQPSTYGVDDCLYAIRCHLAGFYSCFYPHYTIHHIDKGETSYQKDKEAEAAKILPIYDQWREEYLSGKKSIKVEYSE